MDLSLSVVLRVHNAETTLTRRVAELLEVLPDIGPNFEILIVDDGSSDHTEEIAHELARYYPQLRVVRHQCRRGGAAATQTGLDRTTGDVVFVQDEASGISAATIRQLWDMRHDSQLVMARAEPPENSFNSHRLDQPEDLGRTSRRAPTGAAAGGIQMIRRAAVRELEELQMRQQQFRMSRMSRPRTPAATAASYAG